MAPIQQFKKVSVVQRRYSKRVYTTLDAGQAAVHVIAQHSATCVRTLGSLSILTSVGQAMSSAASCTRPTQLRISSTSALLQAFHLPDRSLAEESRSVSGANCRVMASRKQLNRF
jgi:hypothetical protein